MLKSLNYKVFLPPFLFLMLTVIYSLVDNESFLITVKAINTWILDNFGWLFSWSTFLFLLILIVVYFSPLGNKRIGGEDATPLLSKWRWFAITLCTTIATGILFWGTAEPLYHVQTPPSGLGIDANSVDATHFSMSTMFMHWTITPYGIYTLTGLLFALAYYNYKQPFSLGSLLYPLIGNKAHGNFGAIIDIVCLYGLVAGMAASLGTGMLTLMGGLDAILGIPKSDLVLGLVGVAVVLTFITSAASGLMQGIRILSDLNIKAFIGLAIFVFITGPTLYILEIGWSGLVDYLYNFIPRSIDWNSGLDTDWTNAWTIFYWANWFAWAPIAALFLGRLAKGYTVRDYIHYNLIYPSIFGGLWMCIFSGTALYIDATQSGMLYEVLNNEGAENVIFNIINFLPLNEIVSITFLIIVFISYVTAADSNTSAMSGISTIGISPDNPEAPLVIKVIWGGLIGLISWIMVTYVGLDGIRIISVLGGFPALFLIIGVGFGLLKMVFEKGNLKV